MWWARHIGLERTCIVLRGHCHALTGRAGDQDALRVFMFFLSGVWKMFWDNAAAWAPCSKRKEAVEHLEEKDQVTCKSPVKLRYWCERFIEHLTVHFHEES